MAAQDVEVHHVRELHGVSLVDLLGLRLGDRVVGHRGHANRDADFRGKSRGCSPGRAARSPTSSDQRPANAPENRVLHSPTDVTAHGNGSSNAPSRHARTATTTPAGSGRLAIAPPRANSSRRFSRPWPGTMSRSTCRRPTTLASWDV